MADSQNLALKLHPFYLSHFTVLYKQDSKSNKYFVKCNYCPESKLLHRDNRLLLHITDTGTCPNAPSHARITGLRMLNEKISGGKEKETDSMEAQENAKKRKLKLGKLEVFFEKPIAKEVSDDYNRRMLRFVIHANASFNVVENHYFRDLLSAIRPMYKVPSRYVLSGTILSAESARVDLLEMERLQDRQSLTLLIDGWEDITRRSLYGAVLTEIGKHPIVLGLTDLTGKRATAEAIVEVCEASLLKMCASPKQVAALCTDNPSVMIKARRDFEKIHPHVITYACILHQLNTLIGKITSFPLMKETARRNTRLVSFFNSSHYWGGQLLEIALKSDIQRGLQINTESRWYALVLMFLSVQSYKAPLRTLCDRDDAKNGKDGLSALPQEILKIVNRKLDHWDLTDQLIRYCKPLVDAIGNLESREANLADCMIELLRCAKHIIQIKVNGNDNIDFTNHAKRTFNIQFHAMNTDLHWFALFLHPLCRRLAISQAIKSRSFSDAEDIALSLARKWNWSEKSAIGLLANLQNYNLGQKPFVGGKKNARTWWKELPVRGEDYPLKTLALILFSLVPHSAEVERLFSSLGGMQGVRRSRLDVRTFEKMGRLRCHLSSLLHKKAEEEGHTLRRTHAHMHTRPGGDIDEELVAQMEEGLTIRPVLTTTTPGEDIDLSGPEGISLEELDAEFDKLEAQVEPQEGNEFVRDGGIGGVQYIHRAIEELNVAEMFDLSELDRVLEGTAPTATTENHRVHHRVEGEESVVSWDKDALKSIGGLI